MSAYIKISTLEYPRHEGDIRLEHPDISESSTGNGFPCPDGYALVTWTDEPAHNKNTQLAFETAPTQENGEWKMAWGLRELTEEEMEALRFNLLDPDIIVERI